MENNNKPALIVATELAMAELNANEKTLVKLAQVSMPEGTTELQAQRRITKELLNLEAIFNLKPELATLDKVSIVMAVKQAISDNISLNPHDGLAHLYPGKVCVAMNGSQKIYKDILIYEPSSDGQISISRQAKTLLDHKRPEVTFNSAGMVTEVKFEFLVPAHPKPRWEIVKFDTSDFERWKIKSVAKFGKANMNYTSHNGGMDPEFARAKAIKHGLKKRGRNANEVYSGQNETHVREENTEEITHVELPNKEVLMERTNMNPNPKTETTHEVVNFEEVNPEPTPDIPNTEYLF